MSDSEFTVRQFASMGEEWRLTFAPDALRFLPVGETPQKARPREAFQMSRDVVAQRVSIRHGILLRRSLLVRLDSGRLVFRLPVDAFDTLLTWLDTAKEPVLRRDLLQRLILLVALALTVFLGQHPPLALAAFVLIAVYTFASFFAPHPRLFGIAACIAGLAAAYQVTFAAGGLASGRSLWILVLAFVVGARDVMAYITYRRAFAPRVARPLQ